MMKLFYDPHLKDSFLVKCTDSAVIHTGFVVSAEYINVHVVVKNPEKKGLILTETSC